MLLSNPFKIIKEDVNYTEELKSFIKEIEYDWDTWSYRQKVYEPHVSTKSIPVYWSVESEILNNVIKININKKYESILKILYDDLNFFCKEFDGSVIKIILSKLPKNQIISPHIDSGFLLVNSHRLHLPIITNSKVIFNINEIDYQMSENTWYEFDNTKPHFVLNNSEEDRIHLMVDIIPNKLLKDNNLTINYVRMH